MKVMKIKQHYEYQRHYKKVRILLFTTTFALIYWGGNVVRVAAKSGIEVTNRWFYADEDMNI